MLALSPLLCFVGPCLITRCPGSSGRRRGDPGAGAWSREEERPVGILSQARASDNNLKNILQPNRISDDLQNSIQDTTTKTPTRALSLKTRPKSKSKSDKFERNQSLAERNYRLFRQKYNKKARSTTAKTHESSTTRITTTLSTTPLTTTTTTTTTTTSTERT